MASGNTPEQVSTLLAGFHLGVSLPILVASAWTAYSAAVFMTDGHSGAGGLIGGFIMIPFGIVSVIISVVHGCVGLTMKRRLKLAASGLPDHLILAGWVTFVASIIVLYFWPLVLIVALMLSWALTWSAFPKEPSGNDSSVIP